MEEYYQDNRTIAGIKAGSSIFQDASCFDSVAGMIAPLTAQADQIFFVVSALKGETDRTIEEIAGAEFEVLNAALNGHMSPAAEKYNRADVAARLVEPENHSVRQLTAALRRLGIDAIGLQHGPDYPLVGVDNGNYLRAEIDIEESRRLRPRYDAQVVVVPGFGVRDRCTGRNSSDWTLAQIGAVYGLPEIVFWKKTGEGDTAGYLKDPKHPQVGIYNTIPREVVRERGAKVLDTRVLDTFSGPIRITGAGQLTGGTVILPYQQKAVEQSIYTSAAAK